MVTELFVPRRNLIVPKKPSYVALDMAMDGALATTLFDKSRYRSHGTITGASWATGLHGKALDFNPTIPSYVEIPASYTQLDFTSEAFSGVIRMYIDSLTSNRAIITRGLSSNDGWRYQIQTNGQLRFVTTQSLVNQDTFSAAGDVQTGRWYTIGFSRSGASVLLYLNGLDVTATPATHINPKTSSRTCKIGLYDDKVTNPLDGKIEFLRVFKGIALSASEHLAYHNALA